MMPIQKAFAEYDQAPKLIIMITHKLTGKTQSQAYEGLLEDRENFQVIWFGVKDTQSNENLPDDELFLQASSNTASIVNLAKNQQVINWNSVKDDCVNKFQSLVLDQVKAGSKIHIGVDMESLEEAEGVTELQNNDGGMFRAEDVLSILQTSVRQLPREMIGSMSFSDYNPIIEDQKTGRLIATMFYYVCIGICQHYIQNGQNNQ